MNFEHLIEINDPDAPDIRPLSRTELWRGLVMRAEQPQVSVLALDECTILERGADYLERELRFGQLRVRDRVILAAFESVTYETEAGEDFPASRLTMSIEEPLPGRLFLRFVYADRDAQPGAGPDSFYGAHLRQAYIEADIDTVRTIRRLAGEGLLGGEPDQSPARPS
ncbi:MAG TPA: SRPBCC family protein [Rhodocyclaceae bacterium]|nr:SRPBCC family protein [Rhodocyclaceae bacterium]